MPIPASRSACLLRPSRVLLTVLTALHASAAGASAQEQPTVDFSFYVQPQFTWSDPDVGEPLGSFLVRRARATVRGRAFGAYSYQIQADFAGSSARIVDGWIGRTFSQYLTVAAGQAKAPFGRQQLTSDTGLQFVDRGILDARFNPARQPGVWMSGSADGGLLSYSAGVFNGEGMNRANDDGEYMTVGRVVWNPLGSYALEESALDFPESPRVSVGLSALTGQVNLTTPITTQLDARRVGLEGAFKLGGFNTVAEFVHERLDPDTGPHRNTSAWYAQMAYLLRSGYELALRYSDIDPNTPDAITADQTEKGVALSRYFEGHDMKIQGDFLRLESEALGTALSRVRVQVQIRL